MPEEKKYIISVNVKNHSNIPGNVKIPNQNYNILEQAKYLLFTEVELNQHMELNEDVLSRTIK